MVRYALSGGGIALLLICLFLSGVKEPAPAWPELWYIRPLVIVPLGGAAGGALCYLMNRKRSRPGWQKVLTAIAGLITYIIALWLGTVLGLDGTLWD